MDRGADGRAPLLAKLGLADLTCHSVVAAYRSWARPGLAGLRGAGQRGAAAAPALPVQVRARGGAACGQGGRAKAAVWALCTLVLAISG
jgi:hypothetical protein